VPAVERCEAAERDVPTQSRPRVLLFAGHRPGLHARILAEDERVIPGSNVQIELHQEADRPAHLASPLATPSSGPAADPMPI
jgi:hypothetical protein